MGSLVVQCSINTSQTHQILGMEAFWELAHPFVEDRFNSLDLVICLVYPLSLGMNHFV